MSTTSTPGDVTTRRPGEEVNPQVKKAGEEMKQLEVSQDQPTGTQSLYPVGTTEKELLQADIQHPQGLTEKEQVGQQNTPGTAAPIEVTEHEGSEQQQIRGVRGQKPAHPTTELPAKAESLKKVSEGPEVSGLLPAGKGEPPEAKPGHLVSEKVLAEGLMKHDEPAVVQGVEGRAPVEYEPPEKSETYHEREKTKPSP